MRPSGSTAYIDDLCEEYDVCFMIEQWLRPHELRWKALLCSVMKSCMNPKVSWQWFNM